MLTLQQVRNTRDGHRFGIGSHPHLSREHPSVTHYTSTQIGFCYEDLGIPVTTYKQHHAIHSERIASFVMHLRADLLVDS